MVEGNRNCYTMVGGNSFGVGGLIQFEIPFPNSVSTDWFTNPRGLN